MAQMWLGLSVGVVLLAFGALKLNRTSDPGGVAPLSSEHLKPSTEVEQEGMVWIPGGWFLMGSPEGEGDDDEHPQRWVYVDGFWMDSYEVTNAQYKVFCDAVGYPYPPPGLWRDVQLP